MSVKITIKDVPEEVRDKIVARAAFRRQSMQEYLLSELERIVAMPSNGAWLEEVREHKAATQTRIPTSSILRARDADRA